MATSYEEVRKLNALAEDLMRDMRNESYRPECKGMEKTLLVADIEAVKRTIAIIEKRKHKMSPSK